MVDPQSPLPQRQHTSIVSHIRNLPKMAGDGVSSVCRLGVLLGSALGNLEAFLWIHGVCAVCATGNLAAVDTMTQCLPNTKSAYGTTIRIHQGAYLQDGVAFDGVADITAHASTLSHDQKSISPGRLIYNIERELRVFQLCVDSKRYSTVSLYLWFLLPRLAMMLIRRSIAPCARPSLSAPLP
jgi:hypothetical protein